MEASLTHEEFTKNANTKFQVHFENNTVVDVELTEISELKVHPQQEEFTIEFRGPLDMVLSQGTHFFTHDQIGQFELFLVPVRQDEQGFYYEAVFNRLRE